MNKRITALAGLTLSALLALYGCGQPKTGGTNAAHPAPTVTPTPSVSAATAKPSPTAEQVALTVYYGNPNLEKLVERKVNAPKAATDQLIRRAIDEMAKTPDDGQTVALAKAIEVKSVEYRTGTVNIDVHVKPEGRLGAPGERLLMDALRKTFFQFPDVQQVEMTVDGEKADSLMGHVELPHPMRRQ